MTTSTPPVHDTTFVPGGEFTVGAEDEVLLVDGDGQLSSARRSRAATPSVASSLLRLATRRRSLA
jgi:hypothetical protein